MIKNISIIGIGNLTTGILSALDRIKHSYVINLIDIDKSKKSIAKKYNLNFASSYSNDISKSDLIFLMVKPKDYKSILNEINKFDLKKTILVSFMAGITHDQIKDNIKNDVAVIRCMTNISISNIKSYIFYFSKSLGRNNTKILQDFFSQFSKLKKCHIESDIDKLTALYGSGPAYYVYFNKIIYESFIQMGYSKKDSKKYSDNLLEGAAELIKDSNDSDHIIDTISSKGGTTEAALLEFKKNKISQVLSKGIIQAYKKSKNILKK